MVQSAIRHARRERDISLPRSLWGTGLLFGLTVSAGCLPADFHELTGEQNPLDTDACVSVVDGQVSTRTSCESISSSDAQVCQGCAPDAQTCSTCGDAQAPGCPDCGDARADAMVASEAGADAAMPDLPGCVGEPQCEAGKVEMDTQACGSCGTGQHTRMRSCSLDTCTWSAWSDFGECTGVTAACSPGQTTGCENGDSCGQRVCNDSCNWGGCEPKDAGGCLRIGPGHTDQGSNYRCCAADHWQFCLPTCKWSNDCTACSNCSDC